MPSLKKFLTSRTSLDIAINTGGSYLGVIFALVYTLILTRILSVANFGVLSVLLAISYVAANILDFGVTAAIYAYLPEKLKNKPESLQFIKTNFLFLTVAATVTLIILSLFISRLDSLLFKLHVPIAYYWYAGIATIFFIWQNFILNILYATKKILHANIAANASHFFKMILLIVAAQMHLVTIPVVILVLGVAGPSLFFVFVILEAKAHIKSLFTSPVLRADIKLGYTMTYFLSTQVFNIASRLDLFLVSYFLLASDVGHYALSQKIVLSILTAVNSVSQVLSPQFAAVKGKTEIMKLMKKSLIYMTIPTLFFIIVIVTPGQVFDIFFTKDFSTATGITKLLSFSYIFYGFALVPLLYFLYTVKKPQVMLIANLIFLGTVAVGNYLLIPIYGLGGPPISFLIAFVIIFIFTFGSFLRDAKNAIV